MQKAIIILVVFLTTIFAQAQNPIPTNSDSMLASSSDLTFSNVEATENEGAASEKISPETSNFILFCYPSMFTNELFVTTDLVEFSEIQLVNEAGKVVFKQKTEGIVENEKLTIPSELPAGTYFLKIKDKNTASVKLVKKQ